MNRAARQRRTNRSRCTDLPGGAFGGWGGRLLGPFRRAFRLGLGDGLAQRSTRHDHGAGWPSLGGLDLRDFPLLRFRSVGLVGDVVGNIVPV